MQTIKIVVTGPLAAGKTEFIGSISEIPVVRTERKLSDEAGTAQVPSTIALDFGRITIDKDLVLSLFGAPGRGRFDFMGEILSEGMLGFVVVVDSSRPDSFREARLLLDAFRQYSDTPFVVAANKQDLADTWSPEDVKLALGLDDGIKVVPCIASKKESVKNVLLELLYSVLELAPE